MIAQRMKRVAHATILGLCATAWSVQAADDPLSSWNDGPAKQAIIEFVEAVTTKGGADFVPPEATSGLATQAAAQVEIPSQLYGQLFRGRANAARLP